MINISYNTLEKLVDDDECSCTSLVGGVIAGFIGGMAVIMIIVIIILIVYWSYYNKKKGTVFM